ncbi:MAG: TonB-dependent receptor [Sporocytophaga sp.]|uniref:SusC/RagA family TonB-linked outer membrane protein n=1 Tax=Sporocytophaga sp. TaxID=2231183 RepID=UPI001AFD97F4|nr:TonB-dependent receptor [Sporocytophaga sp.]MBO9701477.1 TonB-dependent receptor [Sporocytophaga sp.]
MRKKLPPKISRGSNFITSPRIFKIALTLAVIFVGFMQAMAQNAIPITGRIVSDDGESIPGVTIAIKGTSAGTITDENGDFSISVPDSNAVLVVSYIGFVTQEVKVGSQTILNVKLPADNKLDEVVVVGYGTQKKTDVTGSISSVKGSDVTKVVSIDPVQSIQGRVTGVSVTQNTGAPGAPLSVRIRGVGTINNSDPLYLVNGVPVPDLGFINSSDIESVNILKDASAAAVYGARAANGVVLVTTKTGANRKTSYEFNALTGVSSEWKRYNLLDAKEWATLANEASMADNGTIRYNTDTIGGGTDWQDQIFRKAIMQNYSLSASGGTEKLNYYLSGSYLQQEGIMKNSDYNRLNFNTKIDYQLLDNLKVGTFMNVSSFNRSQLYDSDPFNSVISGALNMDPVTNIYSGRGGDSLYASGIPRTDIPNPLARLTYNHNKYRGMNFIGSWFAEYQIIKGLKIKSNLGYTSNRFTQNQFNGKYYVSNSEKLDNAQVVVQQNQTRTYVWENSLNYTKTLAENHQFEGLFLVGMQNTKFNYFRASKDGTFSNDPSQQYLTSASVNANAQGEGTESALFSYVGRITYSYKSKYMLTANTRLDGSSRFTKENRWGIFPSFAAGWVVSEESFMQPIRGIVNFLKLRASWGKLGNQNIPGNDYPYTTNINQGYNYSFNNSSAFGSTPLGAGNKNIKWETVTTSNFGVDFGFLNNRITFSADYFIKNTSDMIYKRRIPGYSGVEEPPFVNAGAMTNKGVELSAEYRNNIGKVNYRVGGNFTAIKNKITKLDDPIYDGQFRNFLTNITQQGTSMAQFYGLETDGIVQTAEEAAALQTVQEGVRPGDFKFKDRDGDGKITPNDRTTLGSPLPKFIYGFNGDVEYKGFDLSIFFQGSYGNKIFNGNKYTLEGGVPYSNFSEEMLNRWTGPGTSNDVPRVTFADPNDNRKISNYYIENGSFLRIRSAQLGYTLPATYSKLVKLEKLRVYIMAQNLYTFTKYSGLDPEIGTYTPDFSRTRSFLDVGVDKGGTYPQARTWMFGVSATF